MVDPSNTSHLESASLESVPGYLRAASLPVDTIVRERARMHPDRTAIATGELRISFRELCARVDNLARALRGMGVSRHDRICILSENRPEYLEAILAASALGAIAACSNCRQADEELAYCVGLIKPTVALASPKYVQRFAGMGFPAERTLTFDKGFEALLAENESGPAPSDAQPEDGLVIMYTSGTTGRPKAAVISHRAQIARAQVGVTDGQLYPGRGGMCWSPLYHIAGCDHALGLLMQGDTVFLVDGFDPAEIVRIMAREELGTVSLMPSAVARVLDEIRRTGAKPRSVKACGSMADLVPRHQVADASALLGAEFRNSFGATETGQGPASRHRFAVGELPQSLSKLQSSYCAIRLVDEDGRDVADGEPGEVLLRGPSLFSGYFGDPEATEAAFRGGWYHMGDVMVRNPDGSLDFVDRRKYLIKSGGENIYPAEIERVLLADARVKDAAVVRKADAHWGEIPVVFVVRATPGLQAEEVQALCRAKLAGYKVPKEVHFIAEDEMPRSETAKVKRFELERLLAGNAA